MNFETLVQQPESFQIEMFSKHHGPRDEAENRETEDDGFVDRVTTFEDLDDVGRKDEWQGRRQHVVDSESREAGMMNLGEPSTLAQLRTPAAVFAEELAVLG